MFIFFLRLCIALAVGSLALLGGCLPPNGAGGQNELVIPGIVFDQGELYALAPGASIFIDQPFLWYETPAVRENTVALRTLLDTDEPITVKVAESGVLYAVLWQWDFGFLPHAPEAAAAELHGWRRVGPVGGAPQHRSGIAHMDRWHEARLGPAPQPALAPFAPLQLYRRDLTVGTHQLELTDYVGQWVIVGYEVDAQVAATTPTAPEVTLSSTQTRHNICNPGANISVDAARPVSALKLYRHGQLILHTDDAGFVAPPEPGRYCLEVTFSDTVRRAPLTVAYQPIERPGWPQDYFPIHFYNGWGYTGLFIPNGARIAELGMLHQFELGANTFFTGPAGDPMVNALNARAIRNIRGKTKYSTREIAADRDENAIHVFLWEISRHGPFRPNDLGFYVEDEFPLSIARRMGVLQRAFNEVDPDRHLLYCLDELAAVAIWRQAQPTVRQTRAYPIRRQYGGYPVEDILAHINFELGAYLMSYQMADNTTPLWFVAQAFGDLRRPGGLDRWRHPTPEQLRLMINLALGRGVKALTYFCFDSSPTGPEDLTAIVRHPYVPYDNMYYEVERLNSAIAAHAALLGGLTWQKPLEQTDPRLDVQLLTDADGRGFAYVTAFCYDQPVETTLALTQLAATHRVKLRPGAAVLIDLETLQEVVNIPGI